MTRVMRATLVCGLFSPYSSLLSSPRTLLLSPLASEAAYGIPITTTHTLPLWRNPCHLPSLGCWSPASSPRPSLGHH